MIHIKHEDLNKAKQKVLYLLNFKYKDDNIIEDNEYENNRDSSVEGSFQNIISLTDSSSRLLFQILTMIRKEGDKTEYEFVYEPKLDLNGDPVIDANGVPAMQKKQVPELDKNGNPVLIKRGPYRGRPKYIDAVEEKLVHGNRYYRNINAYMNFNQYIYDVLKNTQKVNNIFKEIINDIGFVEPEDIQTYKESFQEFTKNLDDVGKHIIVNGVFKVVFKDPNNEIDKENLKNAVYSLKDEENELIKYNQNINQNYNYKPSNLKNKTKAKIFTEDKEREPLDMPLYDDEE